MLRNFLKNRKAQNTAEYALLIALVVAGVIAMQTYAQRALQARIHDAANYMSTNTSDIGCSEQYEPYYMKSDYNQNSNSYDAKILGNGTVGADSSKESTRNGYEESTYNSTDTTGQ